MNDILFAAFHDELEKVASAKKPGFFGRLYLGMLNAELARVKKQKLKPPSLSLTDQIRLYIAGPTARKSVIVGGDLTPAGKPRNVSIEETFLKSRGMDKVSHNCRGDILRAFKAEGGALSMRVLLKRTKSQPAYQVRKELAKMKREGLVKAHPHGDLFTVAGKLP